MLEEKLLSYIHKSSKKAGKIQEQEKRLLEVSPETSTNLSFKLILKKYKARTKVTGKHFCRSLYFDKVTE